MPDGAKRLKNKVCVVTGAASAVAEAVADRLTSEGATVVGVDQRQHGVGPHSRTADLTDEDQVGSCSPASRTISAELMCSTTTPD